MTRYSKMMVVAFMLGANLAGTAVSFQQVLTLTREAAELKGALTVMQQMVEITEEGNDGAEDGVEEATDEEDTDAQAFTDDTEDEDESVNMEDNEGEPLIFQGQIAGDESNSEEI